MSLRNWSIDGRIGPPKPKPEDPNSIPGTEPYWEYCGYCGRSHDPYEHDWEQINRTPHPQEPEGSSK